MASMKAYLADKYMSGPKADAILAKVAPKKKKKRKHDESGVGSSKGGIVDDDIGWGSAIVKNNDEDEDEDLKEAVIASDRSFKKRKTGESGWKTVAAPIKEESPPPEDEKPIVVEVTEDPPVKRGGLLSQDEIKKRFAAQSSGASKEQVEAEQQETIYRDASGRKIDTKAEKAEAARKKREMEAMEARRMEWGKGVVQRDEAEERRKQMEADRSKGFARHADDEDLNEEQKASMRWNDPAAQFLSNTKKKGPRKPEYTGPPPPPNRFGIKPGYRWDGVDRSNGFEKKLFQRANERQRRGLEAYQWSVDEM